MKKRLPRLIAVDVQNDGAISGPSVLEHNESAGPPVESGMAEASCNHASEPSMAEEKFQASYISGEARRKQALKLVERSAFWSGAAGAVPVPLLDLASVAVVQLQMIRRLATLYEIEFSPERAKALIASVGGALLAGSSGIGAASATKSIPLIGSLIGATAVPTLAAGATLAIGVAFTEHFASGGTLLNFRIAGR
jgi:uncharacterized protein (DUF697 family)